MPREQYQYGSSPSSTGSSLRFGYAFVREMLHPPSESSRRRARDQRPDSDTSPAPSSTPSPTPSPNPSGLPGYFVRARERELQRIEAEFGFLDSPHHHMHSSSNTSSPRGGGPARFLAHGNLATPPPAPGEIIPLGAHVDEVQDPPPGTTCPICMETLEAGRAMLKLRKCGHHFHWRCLDEWVTGSAQNRYKCPMCRTQMY